MLQNQSRTCDSSLPPTNFVVVGYRDQQLVALYSIIVLFFICMFASIIRISSLLIFFFYVMYIYIYTFLYILFTVKSCIGQPLVAIYVF